MMVALALLLGVLLVAGGAPVVLSRLREERFDPQLILIAWAVLVGATFATVLVALALVLLPLDGPTPMLVELVHHCWTTLRHGALPGQHDVTALVLLGPVSVMLVLVGRGLLQHVRRQRRLHGRQLDLLRVAARCEGGHFPTMWLPHPEPVAYSVAGKPSFVVATKGIPEALCEADAAAVLEHERAHLRGHHHFLVGLAEALARSAPWLPLMRHSPSLVRTAVELAADRAAARAHGPTAVRSALLIMSDGHRGLPVPHHALGMADGCVALRLHHLDDLPTSQSLAKRVLASGAAGLTAATLPTLAGVAVLFGVAMLSCPMVFGG